MKNLKRKNSVIAAAYVYADGHVVVLYEQTVNIGNARTTIKFAEIHESICPVRMEGRMVFHRYHAAALLAMMQIADMVRADRPSIEAGSEWTKQLGIAWGSVTFNIHGSYVDIPILSHSVQRIFNDQYASLCSNGITYQPSQAGSFAESIAGDSWGLNTKIAKVWRNETQNQIAA